MKIRRVGAELFHVDGRTDMANLIVAFRNFSKASENYYKCECEVWRMLWIMWNIIIS
jgi:hypothetical protein